MSSTDTPATDPHATPPPSAETITAQAVKALLDADQGMVSTKRDDDENEKDIALTLKDYGHAFLHLGNPFTPVDTIIQHGIFIETTEEVDYAPMTPMQREVFDRNTESWEILWRMISQSFRKHMIALEKNRKLRRRVVTKISSGINTSRGEDTSMVKKNIIQYLLPDLGASLNPPLQPSFWWLLKLFPKLKISVTRSGALKYRSFRSVCPAKRVPDENTYMGLATGTLPLTGKTFRQFFYPDDWEYVKDPVTKESNIMDRIFEGHLMVQVAKCILQGPTATLKGPGATRGEHGNVGKIGARAMTKRLMGYIGFQTLFGISSLESWKQVDGTFDYAEFYWTIVSLFDGDDNAHILEHFNHQVFGSAAGNRKAPAPAAADSDDEESDLDAYRALHAAKKARLAAEGGTPVPSFET
ncbi:hypothetical protein C8R46DRAFT_1219572 [Mycena filopes]|nr:hypothetical protein C8R46DRAFT_1219572 [Mycena filopes]